MERPDMVLQSSAGGSTTAGRVGIGAAGNGLVEMCVRVRRGTVTVIAARANIAMYTITMAPGILMEIAAKASIATTVSAAMYTVTTGTAILGVPTNRNRTEASLNSP
jgi:hypothetical protein